MNALSLSFQQGLVVVVHPRRDYTALLQGAARLALNGGLRVLDGGNSFNAFTLARAIRRHTPHLSKALEDIHIARAFTCYQVRSLLEQTHASPLPTLVLGMLTTFYDESVDTAECRYLLNECLRRLDTLSKHGLVVVSASPPSSKQPERGFLLEMLTDKADHLYMFAQPVPKLPLRLFQV